MRWLRNKFPQSLQRSESGQALIILALGFVGLLSFVGLVTDVSIMLVRHNQLVRAVDSAALNAANQMRSDRSFGEVGVAARMMIEMHGFDSENVLVETCASTGGTDTVYLCSEQNRFRKLVRVGATVMSPTVFLQLIGIGEFELSAVSTSETAVLDVVMVMDVSESMLADTSYEDWGNIGFGKVYVPPVFENGNGKGIRNRESAANTFFSRGTSPLFPNAYNDTNDDYDDLAQFMPTDFWGEVGNLARVWPDQVNQRLWYEDVDGTQLGKEGNATDQLYSQFYKVRSFNAPFFNNQQHPREACRVRFWPYSRRFELPDANPTDPYNLRTIYANSPNGGLWEGNNLNSPETPWDGFVPTYDFYGCCNDPSAGGEFAYTPGGSLSGAWSNINVNYAAVSGDNRFTDLICQPFKQARDATRAFLQTLDFERGDRVALVTFDRGAFLVDPDGANGANAGGFGTACPRDPAPVNGKTTFNHMMASFCRAETTLLNHVGVRAEPNFYDWNEDGGGWIHFADGLTIDGDSDPVDYYTQTTLDANGIAIANPSSGYSPDDRAFNQYPVNNNCPFFDAAIKGFYSRYSLSKWDISNPLYSSDISLGAEGFARIMTPALANGLSIDNNYDLRASCRAGNIGAGLREANNALLDPATTRRSGAVWVIVMMGDGASGASDPVRANGAQPIEADPFYDWSYINGSYVGSAGWKDWNGITNLSRYGSAGEYGAFGLCPIGTGVPGSSELLDTTEVPPIFPYCSDEVPHSRHFCRASNQDPINVGIQCLGQGVSARGMGFAPGSKDNDYKCFADTGVPADALTGEDEVTYNVRNGNLYDVDVGNIGKPDNLSDGTPDGGIGSGLCDALYDTDDYARDWADYVGLSGNSGSQEQLPTIFTIGFGLDFSNNAPATGVPGPLDDNFDDYLGEELLRYIADVGDNFEIDTDYQQDWLEDLQIDGVINGANDSFGLRGPCEEQDIDWRTYTDYPDILDYMVSPLAPTEDCGNYYNAPDQARLQLVFDDIASRMFTRLAP